MIRVIKLIDNQCDRYLIDADCQTLGRQWDNEAEFIVVEKPVFEIQALSTCEMFVKANGQLVDVIQVYDNKPIPITSLLTQYRKITIGFSFYNTDGYVKNSEPKDFYFLEAIKPEAFTPTEPQGKERLNYLLANGITDLRWKEGGNNVLELVNADSEVVREFELSPFVQEQADLGESNPQSEKYVHNKSTKYLKNEGADGSSPYASEDFVENLIPSLDNYVTFDDYGSNTKAGVYKVNEYYGIKQLDGVLQINPALEREIDSGNSQYRPITPSVSDYAVKKGLTNPRSFYAWTEEEKAKARETLGITSTGGSGADVDLSNYVTFDDKAKVNGEAGIVAIGTGGTGITVNKNGDLQSVSATDDEIAEENQSTYRNLQPRHISKVVKKGLTDNILEWTDEDKMSARELLDAMSRSETYSKDEINNLISTITSMKKEIVDELPTENIDDNTIYLVPKTNGAGNDYYDEYLYINGEFEFIGSTQVDLSEYVKKTDYPKKNMQNAGVVKIAGFTGIAIRSDGVLQVEEAFTSDITSQSNMRVMLPKHIPEIVRQGLINPKNITWTDEEKALAQDTLGITALVGDINTALESILGV